MPLVACVDSGASRSFFPRTIAARLGLTDAELQEDVVGGMGVEGHAFPTFSSTIAVQGFIMANFGQGPVVWGPLFRLTPAFSDKDPLLLGREDFFKVFTVTFQEDQNAPVFHLDYEETRFPSALATVTANA